MISRQQLNKLPNKKSPKSKKSSKMEREIKYGKTEIKDEDGKMIPFYYIKEDEENDDDPPPQYKSPLSSPRHKNKKELIKSSKNLGNKIQNDNNISHLDIGMSQIEQEIFEFNYNDFKNIQLFKPFIHKIKCLNTRINTYIKLTLDFEICNVYDVKNGGECINQTFFTDEVIIRIFNKVYYTNNPKFFNFKGNIEVTPHFDKTRGRYFPFIFGSSVAGTQYNTYYASTIKYENNNELKSFDDKSSSYNLTNIDDDLLFFNLQFVLSHEFTQIAFPGTSGASQKLVDVYSSDKNLQYNFEKSKIICKVLKEIK